VADTCQDMSISLGANTSLVQSTVSASDKHGDKSAANVYQNFVKNFILPTSLIGKEASSRGNSNDEREMTGQEQYILRTLQQYLPHAQVEQSAPSADKTLAPKDVDLDLLHDSLVTHLTAYAFWLYASVPASSAPPVNHGNKGSRNYTKLAHLPAFQAPLLLSLSHHTNASGGGSSGKVQSTSDNGNTRVALSKERLEFIRAVEEVRGYLKYL